MTLPDPSLDDSAFKDPETVQDVVPPAERGQDPARTSMSHGLTTDGSRPLTADEERAAEHDTPVAERVYAPASERVPKAPLPGHRDMIEHTDPDTPERHAAPEGNATGQHHSSPDSDAITERYSSPEGNATGQYHTSPERNATPEPAFTRVSRPSQAPVVDVDFPTPSPYGSSPTNPAYSMPDDWNIESRRGWPIAAGVIVPVCAAVAVWLVMRWQRERNKPINRLRRRAFQARDQIRGRVPDSDDVAQPLMGLTAALVSTGVFIMRQMGARKKVARHAAASISEADWQKRLMHLKERWTPHRLELEKLSISKH